MGNKIRVFVAENCQPCIPIKELINEGKIDADVEMIDIESEEGYQYIEKLKLDGVPAAYDGSNPCRMQINEEDGILNIICPGDEKPVEPSPETAETD